MPFPDRGEGSEACTPYLTITGRKCEFPPGMTVMFALRGGYLRISRTMKISRQAPMKPVMR